MSSAAVVVVFVVVVVVVLLLVLVVVVGCCWLLLVVVAVVLSCLFLLLWLCWLVKMFTCSTRQLMVPIGRILRFSNVPPGSQMLFKLLLLL